MVEIAAVDLEGNVDPSPVVIHVAVDDTPPQVQFTKQPEPLVLGHEVHIAFVGSDDRTAAERLGYRVELWRVPADPDAVLDHVETIPASSATRMPSFASGMQTARFNNLSAGSYRVRVVTRDEVGNLGATEADFDVSPTGGCMMTSTHDGVAGSPFVPLGIVIFLFCCWRRFRFYGVGKK